MRQGNHNLNQRNGPSDTHIPSRQSARTQANTNHSYSVVMSNDRYQYPGSNTKSQMDSNSKSSKSVSIQKLPEISMR